MRPLKILLHFSLIAVACSLNLGDGITEASPSNVTVIRSKRAVTCAAGSCAANAVCGVVNNKINCVCTQGFFGNGFTSCKAGRMACATGDPHYVTFDKLKFDYQGTCPYVFTMHPGPAEHPQFFQIIARNRRWTKLGKVSRVDQVAFHFGGTQILQIDGVKNRLFFNRKVVNRPFFWPNQQNAQVTVTGARNQYNIQSDTFGVNINYELPMTLCVTVDSRLNTKLHGLAGNSDGQPNNDIVARGGARLAPPFNTAPKVKELLRILDTWIVNKNNFWEPPGIVTETCQMGTQLGAMKVCPNNFAAERKLCQAIAQAGQKIGPFAVCQPMGAKDIQDAFIDCIQDLCSDASLFCDVMSAFAVDCLGKIPGANIGNWRARPFAKKCKVACPAFATYKDLTSKCPNTCANPKAEDNCGLGSGEGCDCNDGYIIDNTKAAFTCIKPSQCGCVDANGNSYAGGAVWVSEDCTKKFECKDGQVVTSKVECHSDAKCAVKNNAVVCVCKEGFEGNGKDCEPDDKCSVETTCNAHKGHGECRSRGYGKYECECADNYYGKDCEQYKPKRHCADLKKYWGEDKNGAYKIDSPFVGDNKEREVYCDMETDGGGWTVVYGDCGDNFFKDRCFDNFKDGFGSPKSKNWFLGLDVLHKLTTNDNTSVRINLDYCDGENKYCTYERFEVGDYNRLYALKIDKKCKGTDTDGWFTWDPKEGGPEFHSEGDDRTKDHCVHKTGTAFWFQEDDCDNTYFFGDSEDSCNKNRLRWNGKTLKKSRMLLRPTNFPKYDDEDDCEKKDD